MQIEVPKVYFIGAAGGGTIEEMGFKAWNLMRMARIGLPVPPAFVLGTGYCREYFDNGGNLPDDFREQMQSPIRRLELMSGLVFSGDRRPLLVSVRSGAAISMPGMMDTILNVGLCDQTVPGALRMTGNHRLVWDCYRRLVQTFAEVVYGVSSRTFEAILDDHLRRQKAASPSELDFQSHQTITAEYLEEFHRLTGKAFPQNPYDQLHDAVEAVFRSWNSPRAMEYRRLNQLDDDAGTAVTVQRMVFGNSGGDSGSGVAFTRNPATGENELYMDYLSNAQGEDVVSGRYPVGNSDDLLKILPEVYREILATRQALEREFLDAQEFEFTIQGKRLYLLQTRAAKRTPWAGLRIAVEQVEEGLIEPRVALERIREYDIDQIQRVRLAAEDGLEILGSAIPAGIGIASGSIALDSAKAEEFATASRSSIMIREDTSTSDIVGMSVSAGILTALGGRTSHAAVVARQMNKPCLVNCQSLIIDLTNRRCSIAGKWLNEGDIISLDAEKGLIILGKPEIVTEKPTAYIQTIRSWT